MLEAYQVARLRIEMSKSPVGTDSACLVGYFGVKGGGVYSKGARPACVYLGQPLGLGIFGIPRKLHGIVPWKHIVLCNVLLYYWDMIYITCTIWV